MKIPFLLSACSALLLLSACQSGQEEIQPHADVSSQPLQEVAYPGQSGTVSEGFLFGEPVRYTLIQDQAIFQGDIVLTREQLMPPGQAGENERVKGTGRSMLHTRWPQNIVYYAVDPYLPANYRVYEAIAHWEENTNLRFVQRTTQPNYILFGQGDGCYSYVGMIGGEQFISVGAGCTTGSTIHEIGHAVGLWHEQSRSDRDQYITIHFDNMPPDKAHNFQTYVAQGFDGFDHGPFDFESIMMYAPYSFSWNGLPTITRADGSHYFVQRDWLSAGDLAIINYMYPSLNEGPAEEEPPVTAPAITIVQLLSNFQELVKTKGLLGSGPGKSAGNRIKAFQNKLLSVQATLQADRIDQAIAQLTETQKHIHTSGKLKPSHFITGPEAAAFSSQMDALKKALAKQ